VVLQVFIPLLCVSVPFKALEQASCCVASGSLNDFSTYTNSSTRAKKKEREKENGVSTFKKNKISTSDKMQSFS